MLHVLHGLLSQNGLVEIRLGAETGQYFSCVGMCSFLPIVMLFRQPLSNASAEVVSLILIQLEGFFCQSLAGA